jgi:hypothetical protein
VRVGVAGDGVAGVGVGVEVLAAVVGGVLAALLLKAGGVLVEVAACRRATMVTGCRQAIRISAHKPRAARSIRGIE